MEIAPWTELGIMTVRFSWHNDFPSAQGKLKFSCWYTTQIPPLQTHLTSLFHRLMSQKQHLYNREHSLKAQKPSILKL